MVRLGSVTLPKRYSIRRASIVTGSPVAAPTWSAVSRARVAGLA